MSSLSDERLKEIAAGPTDEFLMDIDENVSMAKELLERRGEASEPTAYRAENERLRAALAIIANDCCTGDNYEDYQDQIRTARAALAGQERCEVEERCPYYTSRHRFGGDGYCSHCRPRTRPSSERRGEAVGEIPPPCVCEDGVDCRLDACIAAWNAALATRPSSEQERDCPHTHVRRLAARWLWCVSCGALQDEKTDSENWRTIPYA